jgi:dipeptidyl aminopeptidase/acylaminoacyl peptidase
VVRIAHLSFLAASVIAAGQARAASFEDRVEALFRPPLAGMMALSPDGQHVAYTVQTDRNLTIVTMSLANPGTKRTHVVEPDRRAALADEPPPVQLRFLRWATPDRLVFAPTERVLPLPPVVDEAGHPAPNPDGPTIVAPIMAVDADGQRRGTLIDARDFTETPAEARRTLGDLLRTPQQLAETRNDPVRWRMPHLDILGFFPGDRDQLIVQTRGAYGIPRQHMVDVRTGHVREFGGDWPLPPEEPEVFDWFRLKVVGQRQEATRPATAWRDEELDRVQRELGLKFPRRIVELLDWSETRARVLFQVTGGSDPGRIFVWQRPEDLVLEILRRAPWLGAAKLHDTRFFECAAPDGARLSGYLTWPGRPRLHPPPLLVVFPSGGPGRAQPAFDPEAQVFADQGFAVARLNHRGVAGVRPEDLTRLRGAIDRVSVDDARVAVEWIAAGSPARPVDRRRVAALGRGFGGYLALRALQLQPAVFRGGIAIDAPVELGSWLRPPAVARDLPVTLIDHAEADWEELSVLKHAEELTNPLLLLVEPGRSPVIDGGTDALRDRLTALGRPPDHLELDPGFAAARPAARATAYRKVEEFLNALVSDHSVTVGPAGEVK